MGVRIVYTVVRRVDAPHLKSVGRRPPGYAWRTPLPDAWEYEWGMPRTYRTQLLARVGVRLVTRYILIAPHNLCCSYVETNEWKSENANDVK